jgi:hemerythrin-like metal-binding protein
MTTATSREKPALGIAIIDEQHRRIGEILGQLAAARAAGHGRDAVLATLDDLITCVDEHLGVEEQYMRDFGYQERGPHRALHADFVRRIIEAQRAVRRGEEHRIDTLVDDLDAWFTTHIRQEDPRYAELFRAKGL